MPDVRLLVLGATAVAVMTGCGGSTQAGTGASTPAATMTTRTTGGPTASTTPSPTATQPTATTAQYASIVTRADLSPAIEKVEQCDALDSTPAPLCAASLLTLDYGVQSLAGNLKAAHDPASPAYIGDPPPEIAALVDETHDKAIAAHRALAAARKNPSKVGLAVVAAFELKTALQAWQPYTS